MRETNRMLEMKKRLYMVLLPLTLVVLAGCSGSQRVVSSVYESIYQVDHNFDHSVFIRQHTQDSAKVFFMIHTDQLLAKRSGPTADFQVEALFELFIEAEGQGGGDSLFFRFAERYSSTPNDKVYGVFEIPLRDTIQYEIGLGLKDGNSGKVSKKRFFLTDESSDPRFITSYLSGVPSEFCSCKENEDVIMYIYGWEAGEVEMSVFDVETELAPPPFSISPSAIPTSRLVRVDTLTHDGMMVIPCPGKGGVSFKDLSTDQIVEIPFYRSGFPQLQHRDEMMSVLKYVTTSSEYKEMRQSEDSRKAFEHFWLDCAGSRERARVLIDNFYSRVEEANLYFSGAVEGWKTDRGLIHIIYGPPEQILRLSHSEVWYYGSDRSESTLKMVFDRSNDYSLDRSLDYRQSWYLTVDSWRSGRTISQ